jgi:hypothetical protein
VTDSALVSEDEGEIERVGIADSETLPDCEFDADDEIERESRGLPLVVELNDAHELGVVDRDDVALTDGEIDWRDDLVWSDDKDPERDDKKEEDAIEDDDTWLEGDRSTLSVRPGELLIVTVVVALPVKSTVVECVEDSLDENDTVAVTVTSLLGEADAVADCEFNSCGEGVTEELGESAFGVRDSAEDLDGSNDPVFAGVDDGMEEGLV